ncbi:hypothetical protein GGS24DRAFT_513613 [Hypoxylon argillaceum]|nr:hypothetical protein GGS24DRAFT_513613 [Hypoxylon argillaceum]
MDFEADDTVHPDVSIGQTTLPGIDPEGPQNEDSPLPTAQDGSSSGARRRLRYGNLDWEGHKMEIQRLYLDENQDLAATMEVMKKKYSFEASTKLYKARFKIWGWQKNLPSKHAQFMAEMAKKRRLEEGKTTVFSYGGKLWTEDKVLSSARRAKRPRPDDASEVEDIATPSDIDYETPQSQAMDIERNISEDEEECSHVAARTLPSPCLVWNGQTRAALLTSKEEAFRLSKTGKIDEAESLLLEVRTGLSHVVGPPSYRVTDANELMDDMTRQHISALGYTHRKTQQHVLHCVELLDAWNRSSDAVAFLSRCSELLEDSKKQDEGQNLVRTRRQRDRKGKSVLRPRQPSRQSPSQTIDSLDMEADPRQIDYAIDIAKSRSEAKQDTAEALLLRITHICEGQSQKMPVRTLRARSELLKYYLKQGKEARNQATFENSKIVFEQVWNSHNWLEERFESFEVVEAALQLGADIQKGGYPQIARGIFDKAFQVATMIFGYDDERTVWTLITIGLVHQRYTGWSEAKNWFETAFSAVLGSPAWDVKDGIVRSLQNAIDKHHFSYLSEEGRPFKSIFRVSGISIRPGRLHLE